MAASTSTAVLPNNNSRYDVFISERGPDVKKTFVSHLYRRLISFGLRVFLDCQELQEGEDLTCEIKGAIKTASVHIAIFSPTYADTQRCLDELVLMLETTAPIIPLFYHVNPTELRRSHGEGVYATSLRNLEKKRKHDSEPRYDSRTIENWRNALSRVADISGLDLDAFNGDEEKLLEKVVDVVLKKCVKIQLNVARYPTGLETKVEDFEKQVLLQQQSGKVQVVGITGLGGVGKTTLAKELFNRKNSNYNKSYFLFNIRENAKKSLHSLQSELLSGLLQRHMYIDNKDEGIEMLRKHLSSSHVLLVLDDVDDVEQVHALLTLDVLDHDSLILITSRDKDILARSGVPESSIYKLTGLNTERSRELFCCHAFCQPHPLPGFEDLVNQFLRACDGLPLSLKVFGGLLYGKTDKTDWEDELGELRRTLKKGLQISYDALQTEEKQILLDIACFFIGMDRHTAIRVWEASGWNGSRGFQSLLNKCLVEVDFDLQTMKHSIRMNDHLRDLGRELANSSGFPCRLWCGTKDIDDLLQQSSGIRMLRLNQYDENLQLLDIDENLQLLDIDTEEEDTLKCLFERVDSRKLLWFRWLNCPSYSLPPYIPMDNLRVLEVRGNTLQTLWQEDLQAPSRLRELRIYSHGLFKIPKSIGQLKHLEVMVVTSWSDIILKIPEEFCDLRSLKHLVLHIRNLGSSLPDFFGNLSKLEHIDMSGCFFLERLPDSFGNLSRLEHIDMSGCLRLERLPDSFGNLSRLQHINLSDCDHLQRLPDSFGSLSRVEHIDMSGCFCLERLPDSFGNLSMLEHINLSSCSSLERLPDSFGNLIKLKYLCLSGCDKLTIPGGTFLKIKLEEMTLPKWRMEVLPPKVVHEWSLEKLLLGFINLIEWPSATGESSHLEKLVLETPFLETLPPSFGSDLRNLKYLELQSCRSLKRLPDSFLLLNQLIELILEDCSLRELHLKAIEGESKTLTNSGRRRTLSNLESYLHRLQYLKMHKTQISEISFPTGVCSNLRHLDIRECQDLVEVGTLPDALFKLQLIGCPKLRKVERLCAFSKLLTPDKSRRKEVDELPLMEDKSGTLTEWRRQRALGDLDSSFGKYLLRLQYLELHNTAISEVSFPTGVCPNLQHLDIRECRDLVEVGTLPDALRNLQLTSCPKLKKIKELCGLAKLQILHMSWCGGVERLDMETLISLQELQVVRCQNLKSIHGLAHLTHLRELNVFMSSELEELSGLEHLTSLKKLSAEECVKLKNIQGLARLTQLEELHVSGCCALEDLPSLKHLTSLKLLSAYRCVKLKNIKGLEQLTQLQDLNVSGCIELEEMSGVGYLR